MQRNEFIQFLKNKKIVSQKNKLKIKYKNRLNNDVETLQKIIDFTSFLEYNAPISSRIYCILKNISIQPKCKTCNKPLKMRTSGRARNTFGNFCSGRCIGMNEDIIRKREKTNIDKYGFANAFQVEIFKEKARKTKLKN